MWCNNKINELYTKLLVLTMNRYIAYIYKQSHQNKIIETNGNRLITS